MAPVCEDLAEYGVVLVPPSTGQYFELLADIEHRLQIRPNGSMPMDHDALSRISEHDTTGTAILLNRAPVAIASIAYIWSFRGRNGRILTQSSLPGTNLSVLLPFGLKDDRLKKFVAFWNTILPGSKRLMTADGSVYGDNTDVRRPAADELWNGGFVIGSGSGVSLEEPLKLTLDGVFFVDGGFAGPNRLGAWEQTVFAAEAYLACAALAREARQNSEGANDFFLKVQRLTGQTDEGHLPSPHPPPSFESGPLDPEPIRKQEQQMVGHHVIYLRRALGGEAAIATVEGWADAPVPEFHKLGSGNRV